MSVIDDYLKNVSGPQKDQLERVRKIVRQAVPDAKEVISYGIPAFKYQNKYLIGFAAFKDHLSLFPAAGPIEALKDKLGKFKLSKGTIQFTIDNPISESIIKQLVNKRLDDISKK